MVRRILIVSLALPAVVVMATSSPVPAVAQPTCRGLVATIVGTAGDDQLTGTRGTDVVVGFSGNDKLLGLAGDDVLCGGPGADDLIGGRGHDQLYGGHDQHEQRGRRTVVAGDLLQGGPGDDHLSAGLDHWVGRVMVRRPNIISYRHSARAVTVDLRDRVARGEGSDVVIRGRSLRVDGSRFDDVLQGSRVPDVFDGGRGDDQLWGRGGRDVLLGYEGDDVLDGGRKADLVISTAGVDTVAGGAGADALLAASPAPSTLLGGAGFDYMARQITSGATGVIDGGPDGNQLELDPQLWFGSDLSATLDAQAGTAVVTSEGKTHTSAFTNVDAFTLWGTTWTFRGTEGADFVQVLLGRVDAQGLGGDDTMIGARRNDVLDGGDGTDAAWGGGGQNTCIDTETGSCDGYPWDSGAPRARSAEVTQTWPRLSTTPPRRLVSRWLSHLASGDPMVTPRGAAW